MGTYSKTSLWLGGPPSGPCPLTPHLELEIFSPADEGAPLLFYLSLDPRASPVRGWTEGPGPAGPRPAGWLACRVASRPPGRAAACVSPVVSWLHAYSCREGAVGLTERYPRSIAAPQPPKHPDARMLCTQLHTQGNPPQTETPAPACQALYPAYIDRYYASPPPPAPGKSGQSGQAGQSGAPARLPSWAQLEAACTGDPLFSRFASPSFHVRAFAGTAILFNVSGRPARGVRGPGRGPTAGACGRCIGAGGNLRVDGAGVGCRGGRGGGGRGTGRRR
jgi:hypothetical protein